MRFPAGDPVGGLYGTMVTGGFYSGFDILGPSNSIENTAVWPSANRAIFLPVEIAVPRLVKQLAWLNGAAVSGNVDAGIYDLAGNRIVSVGGVAQTGTTTIQIADITDTMLRPGVYFLALVLDNTTGAIRRINTIGTNFMRVGGIQQASTAYPLPSTVTLANPASAYVPLMALAFQATV